MKNILNASFSNTMLYYEFYEENRVLLLHFIKSYLCGVVNVRGVCNVAYDNNINIIHIHCCLTNTQCIISLTRSHDFVLKPITVQNIEPD
jgi:hypothetical protein